MRRRAVVAGLGALSCGARGQTRKVIEPVAIAGRGWRLVKNWDFADTVTDETTLRQEFHTRYVYDGGRLDHLKDEWQRYRDNDNHRFEDGGLSMVAHVRGALAPGGIESGMLRSRWSGQYGYFEARLRVPSGRGLWPAFWLNPEDGKWPPEIDIVEIVDDGRIGTRQSFHFLHGRAAKAATVHESRLDRAGAWRPGVDFADAFHTFAVDWQRDRVRHFVDDTLVADRQFAWRHNDGSDGGPAHVLVNLAVGGRWPGPPQDAAAFPARLRLSHIRVWQPAP